MDGLPLYLLRLASEVDWFNEKECFHDFCRETARFYVLHPWKQHCSDTDDISVNNVVKLLHRRLILVFKYILKDTVANKNWTWSLEHVLYPSLRKSFQPPRKLLEDGTLLQIAHLPDMYKVFERC